MRYLLLHNTYLTWWCVIFLRWVKSLHSTKYRRFLNALTAAEINDTKTVQDVGVAKPTATLAYSKFLSHLFCFSQYHRKLQNSNTTENLETRIPPRTLKREYHIENFKSQIPTYLQLPRLQSYAVLVSCQYCLSTKTIDVVSTLRHRLLRLQYIMYFCITAIIIIFIVIFFWNNNNNNNIIAILLLW